MSGGGRGGALVDQACFVGRLIDSARAAFGEELDFFGDPVITILLDVYICAERGRMVDVTSATIASGVAPTTALRWVARLETRGLISRRLDVTDRRRAFLEITTEGRALVRRFLASVAEIRDA